MYPTIPKRCKLPRHRNKQVQCRAPTKPTTFQPPPSNAKKSHPQPTSHPPNQPNTTNHQTNRTRLMLDLANQTVLSKLQTKRNTQLRHRLRHKSKPRGQRRARPGWSSSLPCMLHRQRLRCTLPDYARMITRIFRFSPPKPAAPPRKGVARPSTSDRALACVGVC